MTQAWAEKGVKKIRRVIITSFGRIQLTSHEQINLTYIHPFFSTSQHPIFLTSFFLSGGLDKADKKYKKYGKETTGY